MWNGLEAELEEECAERRQAKNDGIGAVFPRDGLGLYFAQVADIRAAVVRGVSVQDFFVVPGLWNGDAVVFACYRAEVAYHQDKIRGSCGGDVQVFGGVGLGGTAFRGGCCRDRAAAEES